MNEVTTWASPRQGHMIEVNFEYYLLSILAPILSGILVILFEYFLIKPLSSPEKNTEKQPVDISPIHEKNISISPKEEIGRNPFSKFRGSLLFQTVVIFFLIILTPISFILIYTPFTSKGFIFLVFFNPYKLINRGSINSPLFGTLEFVAGIVLLRGVLATIKAMFFPAGPANIEIYRNSPFIMKKISKVFYIVFVCLASVLLIALFYTGIFYISVLMNAFKIYPLVLPGIAGILAGLFFCIYICLANIHEIK